MSFISILQGGEAAKQLGTYSKAIKDRDATIIRQEKNQSWKFYEDLTIR